MRKIFIEKGMQSSIMDRLIFLKDMISIYKYGTAHEFALEKYRIALNAYEVTDKEVGEWKREKNKGKLKRRGKGERGKIHGYAV